MIDKKLVALFGPTELNKQVNINHTGCSAGTDNKKRLYIRKTASGLVAYCHHCCETTFVFDKSRLSTWVQPKDSGISLLESVVNPPTLGDFSINGLVWLMKHYCPTSDASSFSGVVKGSTPVDKVALFLKDLNGETFGVQVRDVSNTPKIKYTSHFYNESYRGDGAWFYNKENKDKTLVITEDYLSAYRVRTNTGFSSLALLRTSLSDKVLTQLHELAFDRIVIWLDSDKAGIGGTKKAYQKLNYFLPKTTAIIVYGVEKEPKQCTPTELKTLLT